MIIWLNGAYGAGKTTCAFELNRRIPDSFVYDPENIGYFIRKNTPVKMHKTDFQDHVQWRMFNYEMLRYLAFEYSGTLIVPMTIVKRQYYDEIIQRLSFDCELKHFILYASRETLQKRLDKRLEGSKTWAREQINRCIDAFDHNIKEEKIFTDNRTINEIIEEISIKCGLPLIPDNRGAIRKKIDRIITQIKHIKNGI